LAGLAAEEDHPGLVVRGVELHRRAHEFKFYFNGAFSIIRSGIATLAISTRAYPPSAGGQ
jgi:hypothetical protein